MGDPSGTILGALMRLAREVGVEVRIEPFGLKLTGKGGLCRVDGRLVILVDAALSGIDQVGVVGESLGRVLPRGTHVPEELVPYLATGHARVGPLIRPRPLARVRSRS